MRLHRYEFVKGSQLVVSDISFFSLLWVCMSRVILYLCMSAEFEKIYVKDCFTFLYCLYGTQTVNLKYLCGENVILKFSDGSVLSENCWCSPCSCLCMIT